jgi:hypothetical protein
MWGAIKRHPFIVAGFSLFFVLPLLTLSALAVGRGLPGCRSWKAEVHEEVVHRLKTQYMGDGDPREVDAAYRNENTTYIEIVKGLEDQVGNEMKGSRPPLCL